MVENKIDKAMKPIPVPYEEFESFPKHVEEFFDLIARRRFELLGRGRSCLGREFELEITLPTVESVKRGEDRGQATLAQPHQPNGGRGLLCTRGGVPRQAASFTGVSAGKQSGYGPSQVRDWCIVCQ